MYHRFTFPTTLGFFFPYLLAKATIISKDSSSVIQTELISLLDLLIFWVTSAVLAHEFRLLLVSFRD
jgi:hypothetical protein